MIRRGRARRSGSHAEQTAKIMVAFEKGDGRAAERIADILVRP